LKAETFDNKGPRWPYRLLRCRSGRRACAPAVMGIKHTLHSQETTMFMIIRRETFDRLERERDQGDDYAVRADARISELDAEVALLRSQLAERQVPAVRGSRGRFVKREG
jgi:hypothetical protein